MKRLDWTHPLRTVSSCALVFVLACGLVPVPALAEAIEEVPTVGDGIVATDDSASAADGVTLLQTSEDTTTTDSSLDDGTSNADLLDAYVQKRIDESLGTTEDVGLSTQSAEENLTGVNSTLYTKLKALIQQVAAGTSTSTSFSFSANDLGINRTFWTADELEVESLGTNDELTEEAKTAISNKVGIDISLVVRALLMDCPYDLYWFDKASGWSYSLFSFYHTSDGVITKAGISENITISLRVAEEYCAVDDEGNLLTTQVKEGVVSSVSTAIANAQQIVTENADKSALDKLAAYRQAICDAVAYNHEAVDDNYAYGNPWQLIWVFDGDSDTNVVCEGYSKAFKYLCDLTWTSNDTYECLLATGTMSGGTGAGNHMWNVMRMDDGRNYLVDVTNCDTGTAGYPDELFMAYGPSGSYADGYTFTASSPDLTYVYDDTTKTAHGEADLTISTKEYTGAATSISVPAAATGLVYNGSAQTGVATGTGYTLSGTASATNAGDYEAVASLADGYTWSDGTTADKTISWSIAPKPVTVTAADKSKTFGETDPELTATVDGTLGTDAVSYALSRAAGEDVGAYEITPSGDAEQGNYAVTFVTGTLTISAASIASATVSAASKTYTGSALTPAPTVKIGDTTLVAGTDYTVSYANNTNAGTATVTVTGTGNYAGTASASFTISPKAVTVTADGATKEYGESDPELTATVTGLVGTDTVTYALSRAAGEDVGAYTITPAGDATQGNYSVTYNSGTLEITRKAVTVTADDKQKLKGETDPELTATVDGTLGTDAVTYALTRAAGEDVGTYAITPSGDAEQGNYAVTFATGTFTIAEAYLDSATVTLPDESRTYTGSELKPEPTVKIGETTLEAGTDYEVSYSDNTNAGTATVAVTGKGNYAGTASASFTISPRAVTVTAADKSKTYGAADPELTATVDGTLGTDTVTYALTRATGEDVGTYTITPSGDDVQGNYAVAFVPGTFTISAASIASASVTVANKTYTGSAIKPAPTVKLGTKTLKAGTDYTVSYANNTNAGTAKVTVTGKGNYTGKKSATFKIAKAANPMTIKTVKKTTKFSKVKKKAITLARPMKITKNVGKLSFKKAGGSAKLTVNKNNGKVTVKKKTKKGTYTIKIKVTAKGNANYASVTKKVTCTVVVK